MINPKTILHFILASSLLLSACRNSKQKNIEFSEAITDSSRTPEKHLANTEDDTTKYDKEYFPKDTVFIGKLLTIGNFHGEEIQVNPENENWFGVFKGKSGCYLSKAEVKARRALG